MRGFQLIWQPGLRRFTLVPLLLNTLLFAGVILSGAHLFSQLITQFLAGIPSWLQWMDWFLWILFVAAAAIVVFFTFSLIVNLIGAPFNDLLAEAVEQHLTGNRSAPTTSYTGFFTGLIPSLYDELKKMLYFLARAIPLLLLFVIPVVNAAAPVIWIVFTSWMLALEYLDYPLSNHGVTFTEQRRSLRGRQALTFGFGGATMIATIVPLINFIAMPAAVAGATALYVDRLKEQKQPGCTDL